jgi:transcriptional regulator with XRE-family HTH domain
MDGANSKAIRDARVAAGLTIEAAAQRAGCSVRTITRAESGESNSRVALLARLSDVYDVPLKSLIHITNGNGTARSRVKVGKDSK